MLLRCRSIVTNAIVSVSVCAATTDAKSNKQISEAK